MTNQHLVHYQSIRIGQIREWYETNARPQRTEQLDTSVRYLLVWVVFNALYNVADIPNREFKGLDRWTERPQFRGNSEGQNLVNIASLLASDFPQQLFESNQKFIRDLAERVPDVEQPDEVEEIPYFTNDNDPLMFRPRNASGIASLDNRLILESGHTVFEYSSLDADIDADDKLTDPETFIRQLIFVLYQLRNNIAHGGSAAFFKRKMLALRAIDTLDTIVQHLLAKPEILLATED